MSIESILVFVLAVLVVVLSVLLILRLRAERQRSAAIRRMDLAEFADFLRRNSVEGTIQVVAGKVSDILSKSFGCERMIFLRKQRGTLELNFYHGIRRFNRRDFRLRFSRTLFDRLARDFLARPVEAISEFLPEDFQKHLAKHHLDQFFPIFWRDNLYGVYFIEGNRQTEAEDFKLLMATLAQSLSAAYHIKWHEYKLERTKQKTSPQSSGSGLESSRRILKLIRHRKSETIMRELFHMLRDDLNLQQSAIVFESRQQDGPIHLFHCDRTSGLESVDKETFRSLGRILAQNQWVDLHQVRVDDAPPGWSASAQRAGLRFATVFPMPGKRTGIMLWADNRPPREIVSRLRKYISPARELVANAEMIQRTEELSYTDGLTGLANRRYFLKRLKEEVDRALRYDRNLGFIIFDMDNLKQINDQHGHQAGDEVIRRLGEILRDSIRAIDIIARYGGDEFCVTMPEADAEQCLRFMERLGEKIRASRFLTPDGTELHCSISLGGAVLPDHATKPERLLFAADMALLQAKSEGPDSYRLYEPLESAPRPSK